uniref:very-long-chain 3-oxoacyl-CoA synthase n=1 Tax=Aegilops tauschii subsp. strangulata TaxID=200361 RepID=A0A453PRX0_AEGTS
MVTNALFRTSGAVVLLSTSRTKARFQLLHITRKSTGAKDNAYRCVFQQEDDEGYLGIHLSKALLDIAGKALKDNLTITGPLVLPNSELLSFLFSSITRKLFNARTELYIPDFSKAFKHFCIHAGGRVVIDGVQRSLSLSYKHVEPSRMTLYRYGNTSSSSLWYDLAYTEAKGQMRKGDRVLMIGFGSGYKCNSAIWKCIQSIQNVDRAWADCIHRYLVDVFK